MNMKCSILAFFNLLSTALIAQQSYTPFPENHGVWHIASWIDGCPVPFPCEFDEYMYRGDTSVNGYSYHKLYYSYEGLGQVTHSGITGLIRQDSSQKKVYYFPNNEPQEYLLYDFNLTEGDFYPLTFNHGLQNGGDTFTVYKVDSILLDGSYRNRYTLLPPVYSGDTLSVIEGIGCTCGLFNPMFHYLGWEYYSLLLCFQDNGQTIYNPYGDEFCTILSVENGLSDARISISPNPIISGEILEIEVSNGERIDATLSDELGIIKWQTSYKSDMVRIDTNALSEGLYIIRIFKDGKFIASRKIIIL